MQNGGGSSGTGNSSASPAALQKAGLDFQSMSNAFGGMADTSDLQNGGQLEVEVLSVPGDTAGNWPIPDDTKRQITALTQGLLGVLLAGRVQFADAAVDLFQVAGDFKQADVHVPYNDESPTTGSAPAGINEYQTNSGTIYYKDADGDVAISTPDGSTKLIGQTYHPPKTS